MQNAGSACVIGRPPAAEGGISTSRAGTVAVASGGKAARRVTDIDFWRGAAQIVILIDHMPGSVLNQITLHSIGFADASEAFVFLSGVSMGLAYASKARRNEIAAVASACVRRAAKIYWVHIALTLAALALVAVLDWAGGVNILPILPDFSDQTVWILLLADNPSFCDILPLYVILVFCAPLAIVGAVRRPRLTLIVSFGIYLVARAMLHLFHGLAASVDQMTFNPFTWQLLFVIGIVCADQFRKRGFRVSGPVLAVSALAVVGAFVVHNDAFGVATTVSAMGAPVLDLDKSRLGLSRLVHFLALSYLVAAASVRFAPVAGVVDSRAGRALQTLGRHSLPVFVAGCLLSTAGRGVIAVASARAPGVTPLVVGMASAIVGVALLVKIGGWIDQNSPARADHGEPRRLRHRRLGPVLRLGSYLGAVVSNLRPELLATFQRAPQTT